MCADKAAIASASDRQFMLKLRHLEHHQIPMPIIADRYGARK
jgi:hypothetical protein